MSKEIIMKIQSAEAEANLIRARAAEEAKERIRSAEAAGALLCEQVQNEATTQNAEKLRLTREKANEMIQISRKAADAEADALSEAGAPFMGDAVRLIIGGIFEKCQ